MPNPWTYDCGEAVCTSPEDCESCGRCITHCRCRLDGTYDSCGDMSEREADPIGNDAEVARWARELVELLECAEILS